MKIIKKIVVLGAGYAGITFATNLDYKISKDDFQIILVDANNSHELIQLAHLVAAGFKKIEEVRVPISKLIENTNIHFKQGFVKKIKADEQKIISDKFEIQYDFLVVALGATTKFFNIKGATNYGLTLRSINDALAIYKKIIDLINNNNKSYNQEKETIIIVGGGATGVQIAGAIGDLVNRSKSPNIEIKIITSSSTLLPGWDKRIIEKVTNILQRKGVNIVTDSYVSEVKSDRIILNNDHYISSSITIWTPGVEGFDITIEPEIEKTKDGRIIVNEFCQNQKFTNLFCIGDISAIIDSFGKIQNPPLGQFAISKAIYLAEFISKYFIEGKEPREKFSFDVSTRILSLGVNDYVGLVGNVIIDGGIAKIIKDFKKEAHLDSLYTRGSSIFKNIYKDEELSNLLIGIAIGYSLSKKVNLWSLNK